MAPPDGVSCGAGLSWAAMVVQIIGPPSRTRRAHRVHSLLRATEGKSCADSAKPAALPTDPPDPERLARGQPLARRHPCGVCHSPDFSGRAQMPRLVFLRARRGHRPQATATDAKRSASRVSSWRASASPPRPSISPSSAVSWRAMRRPSVRGQCERGEILLALHGALEDVGGEAVAGGSGRPRRSASTPWDASSGRERGCRATGSSRLEPRRSRARISPAPPGYPVASSGGVDRRARAGVGVGALDRPPRLDRIAAARWSARGGAPRPRTIRLRAGPCPGRVGHADDQALQVAEGPLGEGQDAARLRVRARGESRPPLPGRPPGSGRAHSGHPSACRGMATAARGPPLQRREARQRRTEICHAEHPRSYPSGREALRLSAVPGRPHDQRERRRPAANATSVTHEATRTPRMPGVGTRCPGQSG